MKRSLGVLSSLFCSLIVFTEPALSAGITTELETLVKVEEGLSVPVPEFNHRSSYIQTIDEEVISSGVVALGDLNDDGKPDLVSASMSGVFIFYSEGMLEGYNYVDFGTRIEHLSEDLSFSDVVIADVNNDSKLDIVTSSTNGKNIVFINKGNTEGFDSFIIGSDENETSSLAVGDVDKDGFLDIVVGNIGAPNKLYLNNKTYNPFSDVEGQNTSSDSYDTVDIDFGDLNNDGYLDVISVNSGVPSNLKITYSYNDLTDTPFNYGGGNYFTNTPFTSVNNIIVEDIDKDGDADLVIGTGSGNSDFFIFILNDNNTTYTWVPVKKPFNADVAGIHTSDVNSDGYPDLIVSFNGALTEQNNVVQVYLNDRSEFPFISSLGVTIADSDEGFYGSSLAMADFELDGDMDIVFGTEKSLGFIYSERVIADETVPKVKITGIANNGVILATGSTHEFTTSALDESGINSIFTRLYMKDNDGNYGEPVVWLGGWDGFVYGPSSSITIGDVDNKFYKVEIVVTDNSGNSYFDVIEYQYTKDASKADTDGDGIPDQWELLYGFNPQDASDALLDKDGDTLTNIQEFNGKTDPNNVDTDRDDINDAVDSEPLKDNLKPVVKIVTPVDGASILGSALSWFTFGVEVEDKGGIDNTQVKMDGKLVKESTLSSFYYVMSSVPLGEHTFVAITSDLAGNVSEETVTINIVPSLNLVDSDADGMTDSWEKSHGLDPTNADDALLDRDGDSITNLAEFKSDPNSIGGGSGSDSDTEGSKSEPGTKPNTIDDDLPPVFANLPTLKVNSTGFLTNVVLSAEAEDNIDGTVVAVPSVHGPFSSGKHEITWTAVDKANNSATAIQVLDVLPMVDFSLNRYMGENGELTVGLFLSGDAPSYPVVIDVSVSDSSTALQGEDFILESQEIVINEGRKGQLKITTLKDSIAEGQEVIDLVLAGAENATFGLRDHMSITIVEENISPTIKVMVKQDGRVSRVVARDQGIVSITADIQDINSDDTHVISWVVADELGVSQVDTTTNSISFNPESTASGVYLVEIMVTDSGSPALTTVTEMNIKVLDEMRPENEMLDDDSNGISNAFDIGFESYQLPAKAESGLKHLISTSPGLKLSIGATALSGDAHDAEISFEELTAYMAPKTTHSMVDEMPNIGGYFDFDVSELPIPGMSVDIVIPLRVETPINAVYRKFNPVSGWNDFAVDANNKISSAKGALGVCPLAGSKEYKPGISPFSYCVQLSIEDGGPNDMDGAVNGVIRDPGGIAIQPEAVEEEEAEETEAVSSGGSGGGGGSADWFLLMLLIIGALERGRVLVHRQF